MAWGFVKASSVSTGSGAVTFTGGNTTGDVIVIFQFIHLQTTDPGTTCGDTEGNTYTKVLNGGASDGNNNAWFTAFIAPVTGGSGTNNVVTLSTGGRAIAAEYTRLKSSPLDTALIQTGFGNLNITAAAANELIVEAGCFGGGGINFASTNLTFRTGVTNVQMTLGDMNSASGVNAVNMTNGSAVNMARPVVVLKASLGVPNSLMMMGVGT